MLNNDISLGRIDRSVGSSPFETIRRVDESGQEYWLARELMPLLEYRKWQKFSGVIDRMISLLERQGLLPFEHVTQFSEAKSSVKRGDFRLSRLACERLEVLASNKPPSKRGEDDLYFIGSLELGFVKIGRAADATKRFRGIQTGFPLPLEIIGVASGAGHQEKRYHEALDQYRLNGEWFDIGCLNLLSMNEICDRQTSLCGDARQQG